MPDLIGSSPKRVRYSYWFLFLELTVLLSSFLSPPGSSVSAAAQSSPECHLTPKPPALLIIIKNVPETIVQGKRLIAYVLSVRNQNAAGPVLVGNSIVISTTIEAGVTRLTTQSKRTDWKVQLAAKTGPTSLTATYVGHYPVLAGVTLSPILIQGVLVSSPTHHTVLSLTARVMYSYPDLRHVLSCTKKQGGI